MFKPRVLTNNTVRLSDIWTLKHYPRGREGDMVTQERSSSSHLSCDGIERCVFRSHHDPIDTLVDRFTLRSILQFLDEGLQDLSDGMMRIGTFFIILKPLVQRRQEIGVNVNDIANVQDVVPKQAFELKRDLPISPAKKFRQAVELGLREEVTRLYFDIHLCGTCKASPTAEIPDLETGFVFVEVKNDLVGVWRHTSMGRTQGAETFAGLLDVGIAIEMFFLEKWGCV